MSTSGIRQLLVRYHDGVLQALGELESRVCVEMDDTDDACRASVSIDRLEGELATLSAFENEVLKFLSQERPHRAGQLAALIERHRKRRRWLTLSIAHAADVCGIDLHFRNALRGLVAALRGLVGEQRKKLLAWPSDR